MEPRHGGFAVSGLAVGEIVQKPGHPGDELVATRLDGDLFVFDISGGAIAVATPLAHTWADAARGACSAILIEDIESEPGAEKPVGSSQDIQEWTHE